MKREKKKVIITILIVISIVTFFFSLKNILNNKEKFPQVKLNNIERDKTMAIMISEDGNKYTEYENDTWPGKEYKFEEAKCVDNEGNELNNILIFDENTRKATLKTNKTTYCTLYFDNKGTGEKDKPYRIQYIEDLVDLQVAVNNGESYSEKYFILEKNLDFNKESDYRNYRSKKYGDINGNGTDDELKIELTTGSGWKPIGLSQDLAFQGNFDGNKKTIANIYINNTKIEIAYQFGLFGNIKNGTISNLKVAGEMTTTLMVDIGGIVGVINSATIDTCESNVKVTSDAARYSVGGIVGAATGNSTIKNSINRGIITGGNNTAGIIAVLDTGSISIENCYNYGEITNNLGEYAGGIMARSTNIDDSTTIINCGNNVVVKTNNSSNRSIMLGGIAGKINGSLILRDSYNKGTIKNEKTSYNSDLDIAIGGLVGWLSNPNLKEITNSYNEGELINGNRVGGIVGVTIGGAVVVINKCYNAGYLHSNIKTSTLVTSAAGMVAYNQGSKLYILNSYNAGHINGLDYSIGFAHNNGQDQSMYVINSYNIGTIENVKNSFGMLTAYSNTKAYLNNVYDMGELTGNTKYGLGLKDGTSNVTVVNGYYNQTVTNSNNITGTLMDINNMKSKSFVDTLNNNMYKVNLNSIDSIVKDYKLNGWELGSDGYPVFAKEVEDLSGNGRNGISFAADWTKEGITTSNDTKLGFVYMGMENYDFDKNLSFVTRVRFNKVDVNQEFMNNFETGGVGFALINSKIRFGLYNEDLSTPNYVYSDLSNTTIKPNEWYTIVGTYDNKDMKLYINGIEEVSTSVTGGIKPSVAFVALGQNPTNNLSNILSPSYTTFSDALIFDRALTKNEIKENYSDIPNPVNKDKLLLWYKFNKVN